MARQMVRVLLGGWVSDVESWLIQFNFSMDKLPKKDAVISIGDLRATVLGVGPDLDGVTLMRAFTEPSHRYLEEAMPVVVDLANRGEITELVSRGGVMFELANAPVIPERLTVEYIHRVGGKIIRHERREY